MDFNAVKRRFEAGLQELDVKLRAAEFKNIYGAFTTKDPSAEPVM